MTSDWFVKIPGVILDEGHLRLIGPALPVYLYLLGRQNRETGIAKIKYKAAQPIDWDKALKELPRTPEGE